MDGAFYSQWENTELNTGILIPRRRGAWRGGRLSAASVPTPRRVLGVQKRKLSAAQRWRKSRLNVTTVDVDAAESRVGVERIVG